jgi:hypothetical protein
MSKPEVKEQPPMPNEAAFALADRIKTMFYKQNIQVENIVKGLQNDPGLKKLDAAVLEKFVYKTLYMGHVLETKLKEVKK